jgi:hypothetical protein
VRAWDAYYGGAYISAVGYGESRKEAEGSALAALVSQFGQSVQADIQILEAYREAVQGGKIEFSGDTTLNNEIKTSASIDTLVGAEIRDIWFDGKLYYASIIMDREKTITIYTGIVTANQSIIETLTTIDEADTYTFYGLARYRLAAIIAEANQLYSNLLSVADKRGKGPDQKRGSFYSLEAGQIASNITIAIQINEDRENRIAGAFQKLLNQQGFQTAVAGDGAIYNGRYVLDIRATFNEAPISHPEYKFVNWTVDAQLTDTSKHTVLLPFSTGDRAGHLNVDAAKQLSVRAAVEEISENYGGIFGAWLSSLNTGVSE